jgi:hypothetical protein
MARFLQIVVVLAIALQGLMPLGFMPGSVAGGTPMVICSGIGQTAVITLDENGQPVGEQSHQKNPCAFSVLPVGATPDASLDFGIAVLPQTVPLFYTAQLAGSYTLHRPPSTAPPALI